ncbi:MAG: DUF502 domain-containing protein [Kiritimatiellae bacterium]|nr:DUF502 domain-containing protein [Kiritimatiellia bacterium]
MTRVFRHIRARIVSGILLLVPLAVTFLVLRFLFRFLLGYLRPIVALMPHGWLPEYAVGALAVFALLLFLYLVGLLTGWVVGRRLLAFGESLLGRIPVVKSVYSWTKNLVEMLSSRDRHAFNSVVLVNFPRPGCQALGFVSGIGRRADGRRQYRVFLPTTPNPTSGYLLLVDEDQLSETTLSVEEGIRMVISGGVLAPESLPVGPPPSSHETGSNLPAP